MTWLRRGAELTAIAAAAEGLTAATSAPAAATAAIDAVRTTFGWRHGAFWAPDPAGDALRLVATAGDLDPVPAFGARAAVGAGLAVGAGAHASAGQAFGAAGQAFGAGPAVGTGHPAGDGLVGAAWHAMDLVTRPAPPTDDPDPRLAAAARCGASGAVALPVTAGGQFLGILNFIGTAETGTPGDGAARPGDHLLNALQVIAILLGQALRRLGSAADLPDELAGSIWELAEGARVAGEAARAAGAAARQAVDRVAEAMDVVAGLGTSSAEIGSVVRVISSIAGQTNLLALNASAEAARAGDAATGLITVAGEVQQLAEQTCDATGEAEQRISAIRAGTAGVAAGIGAARAAVERVDELNRRIAAVVDDQGEILAAFTRRATHPRSGVQHVATIRTEASRVGAPA